MTIILFILVLAVLVFAHEFGHFISAKIFGIRVDEFAIGFPPRLFGWTKGETKYSLNLIPFGGYVKIFGENPDEQSISGSDSKRSFVNAPKWKQIIVLLSGIFMNIVLAWVLISFSLNIGMMLPVDTETSQHIDNVIVGIDSVLKDSPAQKAGLQTGDEILSIHSGSKDYQPKTGEEVQKIISESKSEVEISYQRGIATGTVSVVPAIGIIESGKGIGISMVEIGLVKLGFFNSFITGSRLTFYQIENIASGLYEFIKSLLQGNGALLSQVTGPVGIAGMVGEASKLGISNLLGFISLISINLAILNLIPFPALDGGRAMFVVIEAIIRRRIKPAILNWANGIGFALLIGLMIFVTYKDIARLLH